MKKYHPALCLIPFFGMSTYPESWLNSHNPIKLLVSMIYFIYQLLLALLCAYLIISKM